MCFRYKAENEKFRPSKDDFHKENKNVVEYEKNVKKQLNNKLSKLSEEQRTQIFKDVWSWKQLGGYEAQKLGKNIGQSQKDIQKRNERISDISHKTITNLEQPIERGIKIPVKDIDNFMSRFKVGEMAEIPDESGHGSSGFSIRPSIARQYSDTQNVDDKDNVSVQLVIKPNSKGQMRGLYVDGVNPEDIKKAAGSDSPVGGEGEITSSYKSKANVI